MTATAQFDGALRSAMDQGVVAGRDFHDHRQSFDDLIGTPPHGSGPLWFAQRAITPDRELQRNAIAGLR
jgi:hypothetical protein